MACGVPVAAYPAIGPKDLVTPGVSGVLSEDLREAAIAAQALDRAQVRASAQAFTWENTARLFLANLEGALSLARPRDATRLAGLPIRGARSV
jgi:glycosyltransferase involved in cell wall biosynthesis